MLAVILWIAAYANLTPFADAVLALTGLSRQTHLREALHFFLYDTPKGIELKLEKVEQIQDIMTYGVMSTPGVVIDGKVVHAGGVPSRGAVDSNQDASGVLGGYFSRVNREPRRNLAILVPAAQYRAPRRGLH